MFWSTVALILQISFLQFVAIKEARSIACVEDLLLVHAPENLTITYLSPKSVRISWSVTLRDIKKYEIMYKPQDASYRVVAVIAANFNSVTLHNLLPNTTYRMSVTAFHANRKYHSKPITFKTLDSGAVVTEAITNNDDERIVGNEITLGTPEIFPGNEDNITPNSVPSSPFGPSSPPQTYIQGCGRRRRTWDTEPLDMLENVRGIEVTIVIIVLLVWVGAIILFFNRWGKIRMLIPYQPDYKETQLKVPGTGACSSANAYQNQSGSALCCSQVYNNGGCCLLDHCFKYNSNSPPTPSTPEEHPRDCNCRFALLHRAPVSD